MLRLAPGKTVNRIGALLNVLFALWAFDAVFSYGLADPAVSRMFYLGFSFCWCFFSGLALHFALRVTGVPPARSRIGRIAGMLGLYGPGAAFTLITDLYLFRGLVWRGGYYMPDLRTDWSLTSYIVYYFAYIVASVVLLARGIGRSRGTAAKARLRIITISVATALVLAFITDTVFPLFDVNFPQMAILWITIWSLGVLLAMSGYDFLAPFPVEDAYRILDAMADAVIHLDDGGAATWLNASARKLLSVERGAEFQNLNLDTIVDFQEADATYARNLFTGKSNSMAALARVGPSGISAAVKLVSLRERNTLRGVVLVASDLSDATGRERAERLLAETGLVLDEFIERSLDGIMLVDSEGRIDRWNPAMERMTGIPSAETRGKPVWDILGSLSPAGGDGELGVEGTKETVMRALRGETTDWNQRFIELRITDRSGKYKILQVTNFLIPLKSGTRSAGIARDVTEERKAAEETLEQIRKLDHAQKMEAIGTLTGGIAHDFNNTLGGIVGAVSLMRHGLENGDYASPGDMMSEVETIERSAVRAAKTVGRLLAITKKRPVETRPASLAEIAQRVIEFSRKGVDRSVTIEFGRTAADATVMADTSQMEQLILNLLINAAHAMTIMRPPGDHRGGAITVSIDPYEPDLRFLSVNPDARPVRYWRLSVRDEGVGIPREVMPRIFDPFFTTKGGEASSGLGLAMVHSIARQHGGLVEVLSERDKGSDFRIYIPACDASVMRTPEAVRTVRKGFGVVLVAEDEDTLRKSDGALLKALGYETELVADGDSAVDAFRKSPDKYAAILLDLSMPVMNGREAFQRIRAIDPSRPVILTSGYADDRILEEIERDAAGRFLQKPFTIVELSRTLADVIESKPATGT